MDSPIFMLNVTMAVLTLISILTSMTKVKITTGGLNE